MFIARLFGSYGANAFNLGPKFFMDIWLALHQSFFYSSFFFKEIDHQIWIWITFSSYESPKLLSNFGLWMKLHIDFLCFFLCVFVNVLLRG